MIEKENLTIIRRDSTNLGYQTSAQTGKSNPSFHTFTDLVNRVGVQQIGWWMSYLRIFKNKLSEKWHCDNYNGMRIS